MNEPEDPQGEVAERAGSGGPPPDEEVTIALSAGDAGHLADLAKQMGMPPGDVVARAIRLLDPADDDGIAYAALERLARRMNMPPGWVIREAIRLLYPFVEDTRARESMVHRRQLMHLYHLTWRERADRILAEGFVDLRRNVWDPPDELFDSQGRILGGIDPWGPEYISVEVGVPMYDHPLPFFEGCEGDTLLEVDLPTSAADRSQLDARPPIGRGYVTEYLVPAVLLNRHGTVRLFGYKVHVEYDSEAIRDWDR